MYKAMFQIYGTARLPPALSLLPIKLAMMARDGNLHRLSDKQAATACLCSRGVKKKKAVSEQHWQRAVKYLAADSSNLFTLLELLPPLPPLSLVLCHSKDAL